MLTPGLKVATEGRTIVLSRSMHETPNAVSVVPPVWAWLVIATLWLIPLFSAPFGAAYMDTARDIYWAWQIASGQEWPLSGPMIGFFVHIGPAWFYMLALPLLVHSSYTSAALFVTALAGLKYPLAFVLGSRLVDWRLGVLWAAALALPSLSYFAHLSMSHFSVVEAAVLAFFLCCYWDHRKGGSLSAFVAGLVFALMIHAHPTTIAFSWLFVWLLWRRSSQWWKGAIAVIVGASLPFLPLLFHQFDVAGRDVQAVMDYLQADIVASRLVDAPGLLLNSVVVGAGSAMKLAAQEWSGALFAGSLAQWILGMIGMAGAFLALRDDVLRKWFLAGIVGFVLFGIQVSLMRDDSWWYMMLGALPPLTLAWSVAVLALIRWIKFSILVQCVAIVSISILFMFCASLVKIGSAGGQHYNPIYKLMNLKAPRPHEPVEHDPWLANLYIDRMGATLCSVPGPIVLHGALGLQADTMGGTATALRCGRMQEMYIGGWIGSGAAHKLALGPTVIRDLELNPKSEIGPFGTYPVARVIYPAESESLANARNYLPRDWVRGLSERRVVEFETYAHELLVVSNPLLWWWEVRSVSVDVQSEPAIRLAGDSVSTVYTCGTCEHQEKVSWRLEYWSAPVHALDVVTISPRPIDGPLGPPEGVTVTVEALE